MFSHVVAINHLLMAIFLQDVDELLEDGADIIGNELGIWSTAITLVHGHWVVFDGKVL